MVKLVGICVSILLVSCSSSYHIRRAIKKDPAILQQDTIVHVDTIRFYSERVETDSVFMVSSDTVVIIKDNLRVTHYIHNDSVFIEGECDSIFIEKPFEVRVPYEKIVYKDEGVPILYVWIAVGIFVIVVILRAIFID